MLSKPLFINATQQANQTSELSWEVLLSLALELLQKWWELTSNAATTHMYSLLTYRITLTNLTYKITIRRTRPSRNNQSTKEPYIPNRCDLTEHTDPGTRKQYAGTASPCCKFIWKVLQSIFRWRCHGSPSLALWADTCSVVDASTDFEGGNCKWKHSQCCSNLLSCHLFVLLSCNWPSHLRRCQAFANLRMIMKVKILRILLWRRYFLVWDLRKLG